MKKGGYALTFEQNFMVVGDSLLWTTIVAMIPILYFFWALAIKKMKGYIAGITTLIIALILAIFVFKMPATTALMSASQGAMYGILPIGWIIVTSVFLYKLTVKTGHFNIIRNSIVSITEDRRLQALLIAFAFGSFLEGAAGFGAPVAITAALLIGLGFNPMLAASICLLANTAPVAFGAIGIPITAMEGPTGIPAMEISQMTGRMLPWISVFIPLYLVIIISGFKRTIEVLPALIVTGVAFALTQFLSSNFLGPELPDILSALVAIVALTIFLRFWKPKTIFRFANEQQGIVAGGMANSSEKETGEKKYSAKETFVAWSPFLVLTGFISLWGIPTIKQALIGQYEGTNIILQGVNYLGKALTFHPEVPFLHNKIFDGSTGEPIAAYYNLEILGSAGTAILLAAIITKYFFKISWRDWFRVLGDTINEIKFPLITILAVVGYAYVTNASGMSTTLGLALAQTGALFPFFAPILGWIGVFITGSDTSANLLFAKLQQVTATSVGMEPVLALAANTAGGVTGKMISPQSIAVAAAAVGLAGKEGDIFRFTVKHSLFLLLVVCTMTFLIHNFFTFLIP